MKTFSLYKPKWRPIKLNSSKWQKIRKRKLSIDPLCEACLAWDVIEPATNIDHIDNDATNNDPSNFMSLCQTCHSKKTGQETNGLVVTIYGTGLDGLPLDPKGEEFRQRKYRGQLTAKNRLSPHTNATAK